MRLIYAIGLELRKHRSTFFGVLVCFGLGVLLSCLSASAVAHVSLGESFVAVAYFFTLSIPLAAIVFGSVSGVALRREPEKATEEVLPLSSSRKVFASYSASVVYLFAIAVLSLSMVLLIEPLPDGETFLWPASFILYLHFLTFFFSYWCKQPVLGAGLGLIVSSAQAYFLNFILEIDYMRSEFDSYYNLPQLGSAFLGVALVLSVLGCLIGMRISARRLERGKRLGLKHATLALLAISSSVLFLHGVRVYEVERAAHRLFPFYGVRPDTLLEDLTKHGFLAYANSGALVHVDETGRRRMFLRGRSRMQAAWMLLTHTSPDSDPKNYEFLHTLIKSDVGMNSSAEVGGPFFKTLKETKKDKPKEWLLPGHACGGFTVVPPAFHSGDSFGYVLPVVSEEGVATLVLCSVDGKVDTPWAELKMPVKNYGGQDYWCDGYEYSFLPGGGTAWKNGGLIYVTDERGSALPPLKQVKILAQASIEEWRDFSVRKIADGKLWAIVGNEALATVDLRSGDLINRWAFEKEDDGTQVYERQTTEGVYYIADDRIFLMDWTGLKHDLGPAFAD